ncbi:MAG: serine hydrolase [Clostridiales bacterium]|nr:MAG: serine hydrolase [Clostridiales bacterium]
MTSTKNSVLFEKEANKKMHPASITKVMTLLLAAENCNFDDKLTVDNTCLLGMPSDAIIADFRQGEEVTVKDLFMAAYLRSANDAAVLLACRVSGSVDKFVELMNARAKRTWRGEYAFYQSDGTNRRQSLYNRIRYDADYQSGSAE